MKKLILSFGLISFMFLGLNAQNWGTMIGESQNFYQIQKEFNDYWQGKDNSEKGKGWKQYKRWEHFWEYRVDSAGNFPSPKQYLTELNRDNNLKSSAVANWTSMGPVRVPHSGGAGRVNCVAFHPTDVHTLYVGAPSGGFWVSYNDGRDWTVTNDNLLSIGVSDIIVHPDNHDTIYIATGDGDAGDTYSMGLMKSYDAGLTWQATGFVHQVQQTVRMTKIAFYPGAPDTLFASTSQGLYKSKDNGNSWTQVKSGNIKDFEFQPNNPLVIYASTANRIYKSTDGGENFSTVQFNQPTSRLSIAVSPAAPDYLYVLAGASSDYGFQGLYVSTDTAKTFTQRASTPNLMGWASDGADAGGQAWYDLTISVSPKDSNLIYTGGVNIWRSTDGGYNWNIAAHWTGNNAPDVHADHHELEYSIHDSSYLYSCNDGGIFISMDNGYGWYDLSDNLSIAQIYRMAQSASDPNHILTGWQDNGTNMLSNGTWRRVLGGDGMNCIIDHSDNNTMYGALYYGRIYRTVDGGSNWDQITDAISETGAWVTPYVQDPIQANTLYVGMQNLWKTTDKGNNWTNISSGSFINADLKFVSVSESDNNVIYCGQQYRLYKTSDGGGTWTDISNNFSGFITSLCIHPTNPDVIWVSLSNYTANNKVYKSIDGGLTWTNLSTGLPNIPANTIVFDKRSEFNEAIYVGTDNGVYYFDNTLTEWQSFNDSLPNVIVNELEIYYPTKKLRAATYGRGVWESDLNATSSIENDVISSTDIKIFPNPANDVVNISIEKQIINTINIKVYNGMGQEVINSSTNPNSNNIQLDINDLTTGVYYISFVYENIEYKSNFIVNK